MCAKQLHEKMSQNKKSKKQQKGYYKKDVEYQSEEPPKDPRYEISDDEEELPDFSYLLNLHTSSSSHLILKSDQEKYEKSESVVNTSKYFNVDVNLLNLAIKSIPFNELNDIKGIEFTADEISRMNEVAKTNEEIYKAALSESLLKENKALEENPIVEKVSKQIDKLKVEEPVKEKLTTIENNKESMEKWLDDVLDL